MPLSQASNKGILYQIGEKPKSNALAMLPPLPFPSALRLGQLTSKSKHYHFGIDFQYESYKVFSWYACMQAGKLASN